MESKASSPTVNNGGNTPGMIKEFVVGAAGGITQVIIGQPFDIVKVRMQVQANQSAIQVARNIWTHEGPLAFYKGSLPPLLGVGACISIVYSTYHTITHSIHSLSPNFSPLTPSQTYFAGGISGLANSFISGPTEHIRIRLQTQSQFQSPSKESRYSGVYDCIRQIYTRAGIRGLYRGHTATLLREFHSYGIWFSVYEFLRANLGTKVQEKKRREETPTWKIASCGIITGLVLWTANYPFDVVKSKMQADGFGERDRVYKNLWDVVRKTWRGDGWKGFWRGLGPTLVRAVPVSGGTFVVVEMVRKVV
ncbi:mitochondrial carrier domain-containing protein [Aspergillus cavernicola]|uniref:Mitochondrial carrier domain-containing protein n=1 Tax=Aspergillus cavernicola TaxID=176166 RepID=A0ABR4J2K1_9EURO